MRSRPDGRPPLVVAQPGWAPPPGVLGTHRVVPKAAEVWRARGEVFAWTSITALSLVGLPPAVTVVCGGLTVLLVVPALTVGRYRTRFSADGLQHGNGLWWRRLVPWAEVAAVTVAVRSEAATARLVDGRSVTMHGVPTSVVERAAASLAARTAEPDLSGVVA